MVSVVIRTIFFQRKSAEQLGFLVEVKAYYGNVELDSLKQAAIVNSEGKYFVGNIKDSSKEFLVRLLT